MNDSQQHNGEDEMLSALIDGELTPEDATRLRERLAREPLLARRHEELLAANTLVGAAHAGIADEPLPGRVTRLLREEPRAAVAAPRFGWSHAWTAAAALAAGVLVAALVLMRPAVDDPTAFLSAGRVTPGTPLHDVLDDVSSGDNRPLFAGWTAAPRLSFVDAEGVPCRRVDLRGATVTIETLACRRDGEWNVDLIAYAPPRPDGEQYGTASGGPSKVDAAIDGEPFGEAEEREWIERGWRKAP